MVLTTLDNVVIAILPPLYAILARQFHTDEAALGGLTAVYLLLMAGAALLWGYGGDRSNRQQLLLVGTLIWVTGMAASGIAQTWGQFVTFQLITAVGVGCITSIGFSMISDLIPAHRRGLALSLWSMCQGGGAAVGALLASSLGALDWRWPFGVLAIIGFLFATLYRFAPELPRGRAEPELAGLFAAGGRYEYRISLGDLPAIFTRRANRWLALQSLLYSLAYGSTIWVPLWAVAKVQTAGYNLETATFAGNLFVILFNAGFFFAIPAGHWGDRWQQRNKNGRIYLATSGLLGSIPFFILLFFWPFQGVVLSSDSLLETGWSALLSLVTNGWMAGAFLIATLGMAFHSAELPNWAALITDLNLPEHRGTVMGVHRVCRAVGNALSVSFAGWLFTALTAEFPTPTHYAVGLSLFQLLVLPAALCYYLARKSIPADITAVRHLLMERATQ